MPGGCRGLDTWLYPSGEGKALVKRNIPSPGLSEACTRGLLLQLLLCSEGVCAVDGCEGTCSRNTHVDLDSSTCNLSPCSAD